MESEEELKKLTYVSSKHCMECMPRAAINEQCSLLNQQQARSQSQTGSATLTVSPWLGGGFTVVFALASLSFLFAALPQNLFKATGPVGPSLASVPSRVVLVAPNCALELAWGSPDQEQSLGCVRGSPRSWHPATLLLVLPLVSMRSSASPCTAFY